MTPLEELLLRIPIISLLAYLPFIIYADVKWRQIPPHWWLPLWGLNIPIMVYFYRSGYYPIQTAILSMIMIGIFWVMHHRDLIQGADTVFLWAISLFFVAAPFPVIHGDAQLIFYLYLIAMMILTAPVLFFLNVRRGFRGSLYAMMSEWPGGVPMLIPISAALVLAVLFG
jgi:hypothetical protein